MKTRHVLGSFLLLLATAAEPASARPPRVLLLPAGDDPLAAAHALVGVDLRRLYAAQPRCDGATLPCAARARRGRVLWTAPVTPEGCELPLVVIVSARRFSTRLDIAADCSITVRRPRPEREPRQLRFPPLLAFPDVDSEAPGIDYAPLVRPGFEIQRRRWVRVCTKKDGVRITRATAGIDYWERFPTFASRPFIDLVQWNNKVASRYPEYPWTISGRQYLPMNPTPDGFHYTHTNSTAGSFQNNKNQSHFALPQVFVGPEASNGGVCLFQGTFPVSSTAICEHRFSVLTPARRL